MRIVSTCHYARLPETHPTWQRLMKEAEFELSDKPFLSSEELLEFIQGADALISGTDFIREDLLAKFPSSLKVISRPAAGFDRVDIEAARKIGIDVCNAPGSNKESVADYVMCLLICAARNVYKNITDVKSGKWGQSTKGMELKGKTLGIMGLGAIGKCVVPRAKGFGLKVLAYDPYIDLDFCKENDVESVDVDTLLSKSDAIFLLFPLNDSTRNFINTEAFGKMKDGVILVNDARGAVVNHDDLYDALLSGKIGFYAGDVIEPEPPGDMPLIQLENVIITSHIGANTVEASENMLAIALENALDVLEGKPCKNIVN